MPNVILSGAGTSVTLNITQFGDSDSVEHSRINRETRAGDKIIWRHSSWPIIETLKLLFEDLSQNQIWNLLYFLNLTVGQEIVLTDHDGLNWLGMINNPDAEAKQDERIKSNSCGGFSIELEFEGTRI